MRLLRSVTRPQAVDCFFCLSPSLLPPLQPQSLNTRAWKGKGRLPEVGTRWNWCCQRCGCWNIRDEHGEMLSDLPGMHNPAMNSQSFSLRATPSSSHLPSSSKTSPFCHNCLTNQTLIMNLLANYLPDDNDPTYQDLYDNLQNYLASLHQRYPPVCPACQPAVEDALRRSDHRAQAEAWSSALHRGSAGLREGKAASLNRFGWIEILIWRLRGCLFCSGIALSWGTGALASAMPSRLLAFGNSGYSQRISVPSAMLLFHLVSILWIAWDPYWLRRRRSRDQVKVYGRDIWVRNMFMVLLARVALTSSWLSGMTYSLFSNSTIVSILRVGFAVDICLFLHSLLSLRISQPVSIKLVRPTHTSVTASSTMHTASQAPPHPVLNNQTHPQDPFASLSLSNHPPAPNPHPIFGQTSLQPPKISDQSEPMDWEPSSPNYDDSNRRQNAQSTGSDWDRFAINRQRMFSKPDGDETGLESLLAGWGIGGGSEVQSIGGKPGMTGTQDAHGRLVLDSSSLRILKFLGLCARVFGVISLSGLKIGIFSEEFKSTIINLARSSQIPFLIGEITVSCLEIVLALQSAKLSRLLSDFSTLIIIVCFGLRLIGATLAATGMRLIGAEKLGDLGWWTLWTALDVLSLIAV